MIKFILHLPFIALLLINAVLVFFLLKIHSYINYVLYGDYGVDFIQISKSMNFGKDSSHNHFKN